MLKCKTEMVLIPAASDLTADDAGVVLNQTKLPNGMNKKWDFWLWLGLASILIGGVLAIFQPLFHGFWQSEDYEWGSVLFRFSIDAPVCFGVLVLLLVFLKLARIIFPFARIVFRWLFTWRTLKWSLRSLAALLVLLFLFFYVEENWRVKREWENYQREWEAKGEHFDFASFVPPPVPDDRNFALMPIVATSYEWMLDKNGHELKPHLTNYVERLLMQRLVLLDNSYIGPTNPIEGDWRLGKETDLKGWQQYYRQMSSRTNQFQIPTQPGSPEADVLLALSKYDSTIEELRNASRLTNSRFPLNYDAKPYQVYLMHLAPLKECCQTLQLRAVAELKNGESQKALEDVKLMSCLANATRTEPFLISQLIRIGMAGSIIQPIWEGLEKHKWSDAQLAELDQELAKLDFLADYAFSMRSERANLIAAIEELRRHRDLFKYMDEPWSPYGGVKPLPLVFFYLAPSSVYYRVELDYLKQYPNWVLPMVNEEQRIVAPAMSTNYGIAINEFEKYRSPHNLFAMFMGSVGYSARKFAYVQSSIDMARVACALERHRLAHGEYPETLDALAPQFMEKIPHDIIGGQPLHYRRMDGGKFLLYSVGWNEKDDGGVVVLRQGFTSVDDQKSDWVWQFPQK